MAAENVDSLFMTLGLNLADLESGFVAADRTVRENIQRLNRENNLIQLRADVEIAGLDEVNDAARILEIRQDALNRQMALQRDRVRLLDAEFRRLAATHGTTNAAVQRAEVRLERERLALANLERESRRLNDTTGESNGIFDELSNMLPEIPTKFQAIGLAANAITAGIGAASTAVQDLLEQFRELQNQSYELNMSLPDTKQFLRQVKLGGGDIGDIEGYIRGITDAYVKGEYDDPEFIALRKYGAQITDATGRLKDFKDITDEVYRAWEKADAAGEGIEFLQLTGGESGVRDIIQYFQRLKEAREDAAQIVNADIDTKQLHELDRAFGRLEEQSSELKAAIGNIFVPAAQAAAEKLFDTVRDGTQTLVENTDAIQRWGFIVAETFSTIESKLDSTFGDTFALTPSGYLENARKALRDLYDAFRLSIDPNDFRDAGWLDGKGSLVSEAYSKFFGDLGKYTGITQRAEERQREYNAELSETRTAAENAAQGIDETTESIKREDDALSQYGDTRAKQFQAELEDLQLELNFGDDEYGKAKAQNDLWRQRAYKQNHVSDEERLSIEALYAAKSEQIERDHQEELNRIREEAEERANQHFENAADIQFRMTHTAFEKELRDIDLWKDAQLEKAETAEEIAGVIAESASKEAEAFERSVDRMKGKMQSLEDKIFAQEHSQYEQDVRRAQQDYYRQYRDFQKEGMLDEETKAKLDYWYTNEIRALENKASKARDNEGDKYLKRPESAQGRPLDLGITVDEAKIQNQLSQQLSGEGKELVDQMFSLGNSAQTASEAQDSLAQSAQQTSESFQKIEGDRLVDDIQNLSTSTQQLTGLQAQLAEATKAGISAFQDSEQNTPQKQVDTSKQTDTAKTAQNRLAEKVRESIQNLKDGSNTSTKEKSLPLTTDKARGENPANNNRSFFEKKFADNRDERLNVPENISLDAGEFANIDLSEIASPLSGIETNVQGIRDILQGNNAVEDANAEGLESTSENSSWSELLTPLNSLDENVQSIWQKLQGERGGEQSAEQPAEISSEVATQIADSVTAPIKQLAQELQAQQATPTDAATEKSADDQSHLATIDSKVQSILERVQATTPESVTPETKAGAPEISFNELLDPLKKIDGNVQSIFQEMQSRREVSETSTSIDAATEQASVPQQENIREIFGQVIANVNSPLSDIVSAIANKQIELPPIELPVETIVQPIDSIGSMVSKIVDLLSNREPPKVEISPSMDIDLGGAYVFDDRLKSELVNDITSNIVSKITEAVERATSSILRSGGYGFGS